MLKYRKWVGWERCETALRSQPDRKGRWTQGHSRVLYTFNELHWELLARCAWVGPRGKQTLFVTTCLSPSNLASKPSRIYLRRLECSRSTKSGLPCPVFVLDRRVGFSKAGSIKSPDNPYSLQLARTPFRENDCWRITNAWNHKLLFFSVFEHQHQSCEDVEQRDHQSTTWWVSVSEPWTCPTTCGSDGGRCCPRASGTAASGLSEQWRSSQSVSVCADTQSTQCLSTQVSLTIGWMTLAGREKTNKQTYFS